MIKRIVSVLMAVIMVTPLVKAAGNKDKTVMPADSLSTAAEVFVELPISILDMLNQSSRSDMIEYYNAGRHHQPVVNAMNGFSHLDTLTNDYLKVNITPVSEFSIRMLPRDKKKEPVAVTIYSLGGTNHAYDSHLAFVGADLEPMDEKKFIEAPTLKDFVNLPKDAPLSYDDLKQEIPFPTVKWEANAADTSLSATLTVESFLTQEASDKYKKYIVPTLVYVWDGKKYKLSK